MIRILCWACAVVFVLFNEGVDAQQGIPGVHQQPHNDQRARQPELLANPVVKWLRKSVVARPLNARDKLPRTIPQGQSVVVFGSHDSCQWYEFLIQHGEVIYCAPKRYLSSAFNSISIREPDTIAIHKSLDAYQSNGRKIMKNPAGGPLVVKVPRDALIELVMIDNDICPPGYLAAKYLSTDFRDREKSLETEDGYPLICIPESQYFHAIHMDNKDIENRRDDLLRQHIERVPPLNLDPGGRAAEPNPVQGAHTPQDPPPKAREVFPARPVQRPQPSRPTQPREATSTAFAYDPHLLKIVPPGGQDFITVKDGRTRQDIELHGGRLVVIRRPPFCPQGFVFAEVAPIPTDPDPADRYKKHIGKRVCVPQGYFRNFQRAEPRFSGDKRKVITSLQLRDPGTHAGGVSNIISTVHAGGRLALVEHGGLNCAADEALVRILPIETDPKPNPRYLPLLYGEYCIKKEDYSKKTRSVGGHDPSYAPRQGAQGSKPREHAVAAPSQSFPASERGFSSKKDGTMSSRDHSEQQDYVSECPEDGSELVPYYSEGGESPYELGAKGYSSIRKIGRSGKKGCTRRRVISSAFRSALERHFKGCVSIASGMRIPGQIQISHIGIAKDARHSSKSLHAIGRAMDMTGIYFGNQAFVLSYGYAARIRQQKGLTLSPAEQKQLYFWDKFSRCMESKGFKTRKYDKQHFKHVHVSLPSAELTSKYGIWSQ